MRYYGNASGGSLGGYSPPEVPEPKLIVYVDTSITNDSRLNCIVNKLAMSDFIKNIAEFTNTSEAGRNTLLKASPLPMDRNGQTQRVSGLYEITINSNYFNNKDLLIARTILHELVHPEIMAALKANGKTPLDDNCISNYNQLIGIYSSKDPLAWANDQHHKYMAENLLYKMGSALMDFHKNHLTEDFMKLQTLMNYPVGYPKGLSVDFYINMFWGSFKGTHAFHVMESITTIPPILSPLDKFRRDIEKTQYLTNLCGN
jgi:hypothetical protein